jgi:hypothetical protein
MTAIKLTLGILALLLLLSTACGGGETVDDATGAKQVRGQIVEVVARNIAEIELLTIRDNTGREYTFTTEGAVEFTPSHLKEHQLLGQSALIKYVEQGGRLVAVEIGD